MIYFIKLIFDPKSRLTFNLRIMLQGKPTYKNRKHKIKP